MDKKEVINSIVTSNKDFYSKCDANKESILKLIQIGVLKGDTNVRDSNVGKANYSKHLLQPWSIWLDYSELTSWDHDIIKRVLRTKTDEDTILDYKKIIHDCQERLRQIESGLK